ECSHGGHARRRRRNDRNYYARRVSACPTRSEHPFGRASRRPRPRARGRGDDRGRTTQTADQSDRATQSSTHSGGKAFDETAGYSEPRPEETLLTRGFTMQFGLKATLLAAFLFVSHAHAAGPSEAELQQRRQDAAQRYEQGVQAYQEGRHKDAIDLFLE